MNKIVIGVMGAGEGATASDCENAYQLGKSIAQAGWVLLTGGRNVGKMRSPQSKPSSSTTKYRYCIYPHSLIL